MKKTTWSIIVAILVLITMAGTSQATAVYKNIGNVKVDDVVTNGPWVDIRAGGAKGDGTNETVKLQAVLNANAGKSIYIPDGKSFSTRSLTVPANTTIFSFGNGELKSYDGTDYSILYIPSPGVKVKDLKLTGRKAAIGMNTTDVGIQVSSPGTEITGCEISYFAHIGIVYDAAGPISPPEKPSVLQGNFIHHNSTGVWTKEFEYLMVDNNRIVQNGFNNSFTDWSGNFGPGTGYGLYGRLANISVTNNVITENTIGVYLFSTGGANPDHNKINNNTINHNWVVGLLLQGLRNYELVQGNTILSNVLHPGAPALVYAPTGSSHDMVLVDVVNSLFLGNSIGPGSYPDYLPIFGHARNRYIGNNFLWCVPKEMREPSNVEAIYTSYGYAVNGDNTFLGNMYMHNISKPVFLASTTGTINEMNIEQYDGGQHNVDGVFKTPTMAANWQGQYTGYEPIRFWREHGNIIHIQGSINNTGAGGAIAFTLPAGYRPVNTVDTIVIDGASGAVKWGRIYPNGEVQPVGTATSIPLQFNVSFRAAP